ncbi:ATP synthase subunit g, mitochondrial-like [Limulus polyphemus]|uniref:ATP synthase subunit g n=1 Tax=Limulus polyphemus TaxID=6850 RepID=A0ABM1BQB1_LIMPO|nr:ATP synthase subunit g, mitochondrial-like [Limulus polyphemus]
MSKAITSLVSKAPTLAKGFLDSSRPKLNTFLKYARVELAPPKPSEFPQVVQGFNKLMNSARTGSWKNIPVREAWLNTLIALEISFCFFIGECIGKGTIIAYQV